MVAVIFIVGGSLDSDRGGHVFMSDVGMDSGVALASRESEHLFGEGGEGGRGQPRLDSEGRKELC